jgi:DNA-binding transcriptional MerR regulator
MFTVKQVVEFTGLSEHTLRYYEREGLLPGIARAQNGHRRYEQQDIDWIIWLKRLRNSEMSLEEIRRFIQMTQAGPHTMDDRCDLLSAHRDKIRSRITELNTILAMLEEKIGYYYEMQQEADRNE